MQTGMETKAVQNLCRLLLGVSFSANLWLPPWATPLFACIPTPFNRISLGSWHCIPLASLWWQWLWLWLRREYVGVGKRHPLAVITSIIVAAWFWLLKDLSPSSQRVWQSLNVHVCGYTYGIFDKRRLHPYRYSHWGSDESVLGEAPRSFIKLKRMCAG